MSARRWVVTVAAGLVLADASIVTLALPELLRELDTTVEGVAAVIAVYTLVLAAALLPAERLVRRRGAAAVGAWAFAAFGAASIACAAADTLAVLLVARGAQALGGAAGLIAAFVLISGGSEAGRRHWLAAAVLASAAGPALGGALTQAFDWRAIFIVQAPIALVGALAALRAVPAAGGGGEANVPSGSPASVASSSPPPAAAALDVPPPAAAPPKPAATLVGDARAEPRTRALDMVALALVSASLTAVLFGLVLLLIAGWAVEPLAAAAAVTVLPLAAIVGGRLAADSAPRVRALAGSLLVGGGVLALGWLPDAAVAWTIAPQVLAGLGMGMALPAFAGPLLPERTAADAARLLTVRHVGIALVLIALAPLISQRLDVVIERAQQQGVALVLDARLPPQDKLRLAPALLGGVEAERPRAGLERALAARRGDFEGAERVTYDRLAERADDVLVSAVGDAFRPAFALAGALALLGAVALVGAGLGSGQRAWAAAAAVVTVALPATYAAAHASEAPEPVTIADPCGDRELPNSGGITGFLQDRALEALDAAACRFGSSREELVLALADEEASRRYYDRHDVDPRSVGSVIQRLIDP